MHPIFYKIIFHAQNGRCFLFKTNKFVNGHMKLITALFMKVNI